MTKFITILSLFFLLTVTVSAADIKYLLYHVSKEVHLQQKGTKEKAKRGMFLTEKHSILISDLADVMLIQSDGKSMLLNKPGSYSFLQVKKLFNTTKSNGVSAGFFSYVFEKFLKDDSNEDKQKVAAAVFRGKRPMLSPADSSFLFSKNITLEWKPEQKNIPYRITIRINDHLFDTIPGPSQTSITLPVFYLKTDNAILIEWSALPADSRQPQPPPFLYIVAAKKDAATIQLQLKQLKTAYSTNKSLLQQLEKELFAHWYGVYQLK